MQDHSRKLTANSEVTLRFLGSLGPITGSHYLLQAGGEKILIDCGLVEGSYSLEASEIDAVILSQSQFDRCGHLPLLIKQGFSGPVYCSEATEELCSILLQSAARLQEEEVCLAHENVSVKQPISQSLFTIEDVRKTLQHFHARRWDETFEVGSEFKVRLHYSGYILGAAHISIEVRGRTILFSCDLGRPDDSLMLAPTSFNKADYLILESTCANESHSEVDPEQELLNLILPSLKKQGVVSIITSPVSRTQLLLTMLNKLKKSKDIPDIPIYLDSLFAQEYHSIFQRYSNELRLNDELIKSTLDLATIIPSSMSSFKYENMHGPRIIVFATQMMKSGRLLRYLQQQGVDAKNLVLFIDSESAGTQTSELMNVLQTLKTSGTSRLFNAQLKRLNSFAAHADSSEIVDWLKECRIQPKKVLVTNGRPSSSKNLCSILKNKFKWDCGIPELGESVTIPPP